MSERGLGEGWREERGEGEGGMGWVEVGREEELEV